LSSSSSSAAVPPSMQKRMGQQQHSKQKVVVEQHRQQQQQQFPHIGGVLTRSKIKINSSVASSNAKKTRVNATPLKNASINNATVLNSVSIAKSKRSDSGIRVDESSMSDLEGGVDKENRVLSP